MRTTSRSTLLVLRALGLGDLLTCVPALRAIARAFPEHYRVLAAPLYLAPLVRLCGGIDEVVDAAPLMPLDEDLSAIDVAVNLHGRGPQSHRVLLQTHPRKLIAFANAEIPETRDLPQWRPNEHEIDRWCRLLRESGIPADANDLELAAPRGDARSRGAIVVHQGAANESRRWPLDRWVDLCTRLVHEGHRVVMTGSAAEFRRCRYIAKAAHLPIECVLAGNTDLEDLTCVVASCLAVVCGDTGLAHIATALRTPSVVLFGPTSPAYWGPPSNRPYHRVIWRGILGDPHAPYVDPGLASISVDEVLAQLHELLHLARAG
ncbi:MAG TPA: glycosyltransferase family 9 protein [Candidatus Baltobacteraceae bacterium]|jgi:ADP-heptose:LPS heptosyltransferase|nr:glycosyltransferase family 9 protein [Candidatus Baltobacteraceae bacterium]